MSPTGGDVRVHADLSVEVDDHTVSVTADGNRVRVEISDPAAVLGVLTSTALPVGSASPFTRRTLGRAADLLADSGLTLTVVGPSGRLATLGAEAQGGTVTRRVLGNNHVAIGSWSSVGPSVRPVLTSVLRRVRTAVVVRIAALRHRR